MRMRFVRFVVASCAVLAPQYAIAAPIQLTFSSAVEMQWGARVVGTHADVLLPELAFDVGRFVVGVPVFDPALGTLVSAHLAVEGYMVSALLDHSKGFEGIAPAYFKGGGVTSMFLKTSGPLTEIVSGSDNSAFTLENMFQTFNETGLEDKGRVLYVVPEALYVESRRDRRSSRVFDEIFEGDDLLPFIKSPLNDFLGYYTESTLLFQFAGAHEGHLGGGLVTSALTFPSEMKPGTKPGAGSAGTTALSLINQQALEDTGHELLYSDLHIAIATEVGLAVTYSYVPFADDDPPAVPEPASLALLVLGLGWTSARRLRARGVIQDRSTGPLET